MKVKRGPVIVGGLILLGVLGGIGWHYRAHPVQEFRGTLHWRDLAVIPEDPPLAPILETSSGAYELGEIANSAWRDRLRALDGQQVIVRGTVHLVRVRSMMGNRQHRCIRIRDLQLDPTGTTCPSAPGSG